MASTLPIMPFERSLDGRSWRYPNSALTLSPVEYFTALLHAHDVHHNWLQDQPLPCSDLHGPLTAALSEARLHAIVKHDENDGPIDIVKAAGAVLPNPIRHAAPGPEDESLFTPQSCPLAVLVEDAGPGTKDLIRSDLLQIFGNDLGDFPEKLISAAFAIRQPTSDVCTITIHQDWIRPREQSIEGLVQVLTYIRDRGAKASLVCTLPRCKSFYLTDTRDASDSRYTQREISSVQQAPVSSAMETDTLVE